MKKQKILPIILCGGSGTRLWPSSRASFPKQFIKGLSKNKKSLLQETILRIAGLKNIDDPIFILGLPRSGSTMIEQILSSHSLIEGTQELPNILTISISVLTIFMALLCYLIIPSTNSATDEGDKKKFNQLHSLSVFTTIGILLLNISTFFVAI